MRRNRIDPLAAFLLAALPLLIGSTHADNFYLVPDVPADLGAATFLPWQIVRNDTGIHSSVLALPEGTAIDALHRMDNGHWLVSVESPVMLGALLAQPGDVLEVYDSPGQYAEKFDGVGNGVPAGVNVDAVFLDGGDSGDLVMSFDVATTIGGTTFEPADLVRFNGGSFGLYFDASAATPPIPSSSNVVGADARSAITILTFDVPTTLGGQTFIPGQLVEWDGSRFTSSYFDPAWPAGVRADAVALLARPGTVPPTIDVTTSQARGKLTITWEASCSAGAEDYAIYEGVIGSWYSHLPIDCSDDGGDRREDVVFSAGDRYYMVVPLNANEEGSYGTDARGMQRPPGATTCVSFQTVGPCP